MAKRPNSTSAALDQVNKAVPRSTPDAVREIIRAARLHNLFIHFEFGNELLLDGLLPNTRRYLQKE
jgi:hypothetical protein